MVVKIPKKVQDRFISQVKSFQGHIADAKARDVSEADTVTLVKDMLAYVFGFDKYSELTSEQQIKGTFCDLAVKVQGKVNYLIEVKAVGESLDSRNNMHTRQAVNYGAHEGIEWIVLTNAQHWRLYRISFGQPIKEEEVMRLDFLEVNPRSQEDQSKLMVFSREVLADCAMDTFHQHAQILNRFTVAQVLLSETVIGMVRRELRRMFPDFKVDPLQISEIMTAEILKREVVEGDKAKEAAQKLKKAVNRIAKLSAKADNGKAGEDETEEPISVTDDVEPEVGSEA